MKEIEQVMAKIENDIYPRLNCLEDYIHILTKYLKIKDETEQLKEPP